jgi:hypothetical protein
MLRPTPPNPITSTLAPASTAAVLTTAPTPVATPQAMRHARSSGSPRGTTTRPRTSTFAASAYEPTPTKATIGSPRRLSQVCSGSGAAQRYDSPRRQK